MPTYTYECKSCGAQQDEFHSMSATPKIVCAICGSKKMVRLVGAGAGLIFKGTGFYETDYKKSGAKNGGSHKSEQNGSGSKPSESKATESKATESSSETRKETKKDGPSSSKGNES